jgi:hypothetical protein
MKASTSICFNIAISLSLNLLRSLSPMIDKLSLSLFTANISSLLSNLFNSCRQPDSIRFKMSPFLAVILFTGAVFSRPALAIPASSITSHVCIAN